MGVRVLLLAGLMSLGGIWLRAEPQSGQGGDPVVAAAAVTSAIITPSTLTFDSNDPDVMATAPTPVTVAITVTDGQPSRSWFLRVRAASPALTGCPVVPASALRLACTSASVSEKHPNNGLGNGSATCGAPVNISTSSQPVASGRLGNRDRVYTVTLQVGFTDGWHYQVPAGSPCSANLSYTFEIQ
jgi:hypothetical protein